MVMKMSDELIKELPYVEGLEANECAKYSRLLTEKLTGVKYNPGHAWKLGKNNVILVDDKSLDKSKGDLGEFVELMEPGKTIVIFHNKLSLFNRFGRIGTHAGVYAGKHEGKIMFAEQYIIEQQIRSYEDMRKKGLNAKQILAPRGK